MKNEIIKIIYRYSPLCTTYLVLWRICFFVVRSYYLINYLSKGIIKKGDTAIPKIIHLCWFSNQPYPGLVLRCILSWCKFFPDYKILKWDSKKALATGIPFVKEAIEKRKWAFAADAIRQYAIYTYGGIYMDSDIIVKKRFTEYLCRDNVFFREYYPDRLKFEKQHPELTKEELVGSEIQAALFACKKGSVIIRDILSYYLTAHFIKEDGTLSISPIAPQIMAWHMEKYGFKYENIRQILPENTIIYEHGLVGCHRRLDNQHSIAVHCCTSSWQ